MIGWQPVVPRDLRVRTGALRAFDVKRKLRRLVRSIGKTGTAVLLATDRDRIIRILNAESVDSAIALRIIDSEYLLDCALRVFYPDELGPWLSQPEPLLKGATPLNVLFASGSAPVVAALSRIAAGAFA